MWLRAALLGLGCVVVLGLGTAYLRAASARAQPLTPAELGVKAAVQDLWQALDVAAATGDEAALGPLFDLNTAAGRASLAHAQARVAFVQAWAGARGIHWLRPEVSVRTPSIHFNGASLVAVTAIVSEAWPYAYGSVPTAANTFGLGREHYLTLRRTDDGWKIAQDWFTDPLDQDTRIPGPARPSAPVPIPAARSAAAIPAAARGGLNREGALRYVNTYCGAAPGCGNNGRYNARFYNYNTDGGDCTNFISQALSLGGGLRQNSTWMYDRRTGEGTATWVQSSTLVYYLLGSGLARVAARGPYAKVAAAAASLTPGDVIAYSEKGEVVHLAMVTGFDPHGYALVNSHTADRYHVPWDVGWDRNAVFVLLHLTGGARPAVAPTTGFLLARASGCGVPSVG